MQLIQLQGLNFQSLPLIFSNLFKMIISKTAANRNDGGIFVYNCLFWSIAFEFIHGLSLGLWEVFQWLLPIFHRPQA
jgi:hypothetical protein